MSDQHVHTGCTHSDNIVLGGGGGGGGGAEKDKEAEAEAEDKAEAVADGKEGPLPAARIMTLIPRRRRRHHHHHHI